jgi:carbon storage regulator CsrA
MLVLSRRRNEKIVLPSTGATIEVLAIKPNVIRLGIEAPPGALRPGPGRRL